MRYRPRAVGIFIAGVILLTACSRTASADLEGYVEGPGARQLTVTYISGPDDRLDGGEVVAEDEKTVTVRVGIKRAEGMSDEIGVRHQVVVDLDQPLAGRRVVDESGRDVPPISPSDTGN